MYSFIKNILYIILKYNNVLFTKEILSWILLKKKFYMNLIKFNKCVTLKSIEFFRTFVCCNLKLNDNQENFYFSLFYAACHRCVVSDLLKIYVYICRCYR